MQNLYKKNDDLKLFVVLIPFPEYTFINRQTNPNLVLIKYFLLQKE